MLFFITSIENRIERHNRTVPPPDRYPSGNAGSVRIPDATVFITMQLPSGAFMKTARRPWVLTGTPAQLREGPLAVIYGGHPAICVLLSESVIFVMRSPPDCQFPQ